MVQEIRLKEKSVVLTYIVLFSISWLTFCLGQYSNDDGDWVIQSPSSTTQRQTWILYGLETELPKISGVGQSDEDDLEKSILQPILTTDDTFQDFNDAPTVNSSVTDSLVHPVADDNAPAEESSRYVLENISSDEELINEGQNLANINSNTATEITLLNSTLTDFYTIEQGDLSNSSSLASHYPTKKVIGQDKINFLSNVFGIKVTQNRKPSEGFSQTVGGENEQTAQTTSGAASPPDLDSKKIKFLSDVFGIKVSQTRKPVQDVGQNVEVIDEQTTKILPGLVTLIHPEEQGAEFISESSKSEDEAKEHSATYDESEDKYKQEQYDKENSLASQGILKAEYPQSDDVRLNHDHMGHLTGEPEEDCSGFLRFHRGSNCKKDFSLIGLGFIGILAISFAFVFILFFCVCKGCRCIQFYLRRRQCSYVPLSTKE